MKTNRLFPVIICLLLTSTVVSQTLIPYYKDGKYGYCNLNKEIVIKPQYDGCGFFNDDRAWFKKGDKYGYIDSKGHIIIPATYSEASNFSYGMAIVHKKGKIWGKDRNYVLNSNGKKLNKNGSIHVFRVADALIAYEDWGWYIIDSTGKSKYEFKNRQITIDWDNRDYIYVSNDDRDTVTHDPYLNLKTGKYQAEKSLPKLTFDNPDSLQLVAASLSIGGLTIERGQVIDRTNAVIIPPNYARLIAGNNKEFIFCIDNKQNPGTSQIYISSKKKLSLPFPFVIEDIPFEQNEDAYGYQRIDGKYYFLCQLKVNGHPSTEYICIDEDGKVFADL